MRVLFTSQPNPTHAAMLLPCARALVEAGHEVRFATPASLAAKLEKQNFDTVAVGFDWAAMGPMQAFPGIQAGWTPTNFAFEDAFAGPTAEKMIPDLLALAERWRPDVIVREHMEFGGYLAAEILGIPHATCGMHSTAQSYFKLWAPEWLDEHRAAYGLPKDPSFAAPFRYLDIVVVPPSWRRKSDAYPEVAHFFNTATESTSTNQLPAWLDDLEKRPLVHVTFGTTAWTATPYLLVVRPLENEPINLLVASGSIDPALLEPLSDNTRVERFFPHDVLLPRCDLIVTHGGANTTLAAMQVGKPMLILPMVGDQPHTAATAEEVGIAKSLAVDARSPENILHAVRDLLGTPSFAQRAREVRAELKALPPISSAVDLIAKLARTKQPQRNSP